MTPLKDHSNLVAKPKDVEIYGLPDEEFIIAVLRNSELQENTETIQ